MAPNWEWVEGDDATRVIVVSGDLDVAVGTEFVEMIDRVLAADDAPPHVVIELGAVDFIDSSGLRALLELYRTHGERVRFGELSAPVRRLLELTGTLEHLGFGEN